MSVRVGRTLDEYCKNNIGIRDKVEELMYELNAALDSWNGKGEKNEVNKLILALESLIHVFRAIREREKKQ